MVLKKLIISMCFIILAGCPSPPNELKGSGVYTDAPIGYTIECIKNPKLENCNDNIR